MLGNMEDLPFRRVIRLFALSIVFVSALSLITNAIHPRQMDFISFWAAGKLSLGGNPLGAYDIAVHKEVQLALVQFQGIMPFGYPPPFLLVVSPFALIPYGVSAIVWVGGSFALYILSTRRIAPSVGWVAAAFPPVLVNGIIGQNGLLTAAIFISAMSLLQNKPFGAGVLLGCLIIKPQLAMLLPIALMAGGHWRAFFGATASSIGLLVGAMLMFGVDSYLVFVELMPLYASIVADGLVDWHKMASVYASIRLAGGTAAMGWSVQIAVGCVAGITVWTTWRSKVELSAKAAVLAAATVLISPYIYLYDTVLLLLPFLWLIRNGENPRLLAVLWCIPLVVALQNWIVIQSLNPAPLLPIALLVLVRRRLRASLTTTPG